MTFSCGGALSSDERHLHAEDDDRMLIYKNSQETGPMPHAAPDIFTVTFHNRFCFFLFFVCCCAPDAALIHLSCCCFTEMVIDTQRWRNYSWCWPWNRVRRANRSLVRRLLAQKSIRAVVCCLARRNVPGIGANRRRTCPVAAYRLCTQLFSVIDPNNQQVFSLCEQREKEIGRTRGVKFFAARRPGSLSLHTHTRARVE